MTGPQIQASDIAGAHRGVPGGMDLAAVVGDDAVVLAVVDHDVGIGDAGGRTVQVVDRRGPIGRAAPVVVVESGIDVGEIDRLGVDVFRARDRAFGADPRAGEQQIGQGAGLAHGVVLVIHEGRVHHVDPVVIVFEAADREVRQGRLGQAAAVGDFLRRRRIAFIVGLAHHQGIHQPGGEPFAAEGAGRIGHADGVVGELGVAEDEQLAPGPDAAVAVLVAGQAVEVGFHHLAVGVGRIFQRREGAERQVEGVVFIDVAVEHEPVEVGMGHIAPEGAHRRSARPDGLADLRILERALRVFRQGQPEAVLVGTGRHIVDVAVVRVGDPEGGRRVVRGQQGGLAGEADRPHRRPILGRIGELAVGGEVDRHAVQCRMTLGLDRQVPDEGVAVLDPVFEEEAVADGVVGDVVLHPQVVGAVHRHAAVVGVVDRGVLDILALAVAQQVPVDRIAGQMHVLAHAIELDAGQIHPGAGHRHDVAAEIGRLGVLRRLNLDVPGQQADLAALVDAVGDPAEVHVAERRVEGEGVAADRGDRALLGLARIEVGRGQDDDVALAPAGGVEHRDGSGAGLGRLGQPGPAVGAVAVQAEGSAQQHDPTVAHGVDVLVLDVVGQGDDGLARVGMGLAADVELAAGQIDPVGPQLEVPVVGEAEPALDRQAAQGRRTDVEDEAPVARDGHRVAFARDLAVGPGLGIGPARRADRRRRGRGRGHLHVRVVFLSAGRGRRAERERRRQEPSQTKPARWHAHVPLLLGAERPASLMRHS